MALRRNVLIFHQAALGDFIVTWPLAVALGRTYPQSRILYVTAGQKGKLAEDVLRVESTDVELGWHALFAEDAGTGAVPMTPPEPVLKWLAGAHTILSFVSTGDDVWARNVRRLAPEAQVVYLAMRPPTPEGIAALPATLQPPPSLRGHVTAGLLEQLRPHLPIAAAMQQILASVCERGVGRRPKGDDAIVIHPGGGKADKCWPFERFVALIERFRADPAFVGRPVRVLLGEVEIEKWPAGQLAGLRALADVRPLTTLADLLRETAGAVFIGNDSGPGHLAGIVGLPTISLFGSLNWHAWHPLGPAVRVLSADSLAALQVDTVYDAVRAVW